MLGDMEALAAAEAARQQAGASPGSDDNQGYSVSDDLLAASTWMQKNGNKSKPKQTSKRDPNLGTDEDGPLVSSYSPVDKTVAEDGQSLGSQTPNTQAMFRAQYGGRAEIEWVKEHENELKKNRQLYGTSNVPDWMKTKSAPTSAGSSTVAPSSTSQTAPTTSAIAPYNAGGAPTTLGPATTSGANTPSTTAPVTPTIAPSPPSEDDMITIENSQGIRKTVHRGNFGDNQTISSAKYSVVYTPAGGWKIVSDPKPITTQKQSYVDENGVEVLGAKPAPERNIVGYDPVTTQTKNPTLAEFRGETPIPTSARGASINIDEKPIDMLAQRSVQRTGLAPAQAAVESKRILDGIGGLLRGDRDSAWAEPYLNDVARIAWARQERQTTGKVADPLQTPLEYIEKWKDAFYGSDAGVPLVKDLDQQMIDNAVSRTPSGNTKFNWKDAFGENGEAGLISRQVASNDCGPNAYSTILRSRGYNLDPESSFNYAKKYGYHNGDQFAGPAAFARMLKQEAGLDSQLTNMDPKLIDSELDAGRPVAMSSSTHYWVASAYRDTEESRQYYVGATGAVAGNPVWARLDQLEYAGASPNALIIARGDVDPNSRSVSELGLRPPGAASANRANLSRQTTAANPGTSWSAANANRSTTQNLSNTESIGTTAYQPLIQQASKAENTDPLMIEAMMGQESGGDPTARSKRGAGGLMQLMPDTARGLGVQDVDDPVQNIRGGAKYFRQLLDQFDNDLDLALAAYNAGPGAVMQYGGIPPYEETQRYVRDVKARYQRLVGTR